MTQTSMEDSNAEMRKQWFNTESCSSEVIIKSADRVTCESGIVAQIDLIKS